MFSKCIMYYMIYDIVEYGYIFRIGHFLLKLDNEQCGVSNKYKETKHMSFSCCSLDNYNSCFKYANVFSNLQLATRRNHLRVVAFKEFTKKNSQFPVLNIKHRHMSPVLKKVYIPELYDLYKFLIVNRYDVKYIKRSFSTFAKKMRINSEIFNIITRIKTNINYRKYKYQRMAIELYKYIYEEKYRIVNYPDGYDIKISLDRKLSRFYDIFDDDIKINKLSKFFNSLKYKITYVKK